MMSTIRKSYSTRSSQLLALKVMHNGSLNTTYGQRVKRIAEKIVPTLLRLASL